ncbi:MULTISPECIES: DUF6894 family protein [Methylobacteriaceae]|jgi:hypothetical protein|uniref:DUF6894 domain-containing protein n=6 Tax=Methylobacteriaceae TaxID=119045 RepID=A0A509EMW9_9HYPH|nr:MULTISPECIES: hypothetical protein [Methylobacteriaceae]MDV2986655.1 hypothetical protein [Methylobacteriaceae bacterium AG10]MRI53687.1 hypothetical protein [Methylobacterium sp. DB1607]ACS40441.1 conserved hypothetical protein [Methylorubrum extorquens AM1]MBB5761774.1 hypothetical protein [Methylorubrum rhodesianum]MBD8906516.1 hypothetical protein [Methylorubrum zatmanii]
MPRYFFDFSDANGKVFDRDGLDLADREAVREEVSATLSELARDLPPGEDRTTLIARVRDEAGGVLLIATLSLVVEWVT